MDEVVLDDGEGQMIPGYKCGLNLLYSSYSREKIPEKINCKTDPTINWTQSMKGNNIKVAAKLKGLVIFFLAYSYLHYRPSRPMGNVDARIIIFAATALRRSRVASPTLGHLYPWESPCTHFTGGWVDLRICLHMKEWRKISTL